jgi:hypothetical protein
LSLADYLTGLFFFVVTWGALLVAAEVIVRRRYSHLHGTLRVAAFGVLASAGLVGVHVLAGAMTLLAPVTVTVLAVATLVGVLLLVRPSEERPSGGSGIVPNGDRFSQLLGAVTLIAFTACVLYTLRIFYSTPVLHVDALSFHLPGVARWIQSGSIWENDEFLARFPTGAYPNNGDIMFLAAVLPWRNDAFVRLVDAPYLALLGVAMYALARELDVPRAIAVLFATMVLSIRAISSFALVQLDPDVILLATFVCGTVFLLRYLKSPRRSELVLAGIALGLAFGTKWYGLAVVAVLLGAWAVVKWISSRRLKTVALETAAAGGLVLLFGGVWLIRNWITTGDPFYPGRVLFFKPPVDLYLKLYGYSIASRVGQWHSWTHYILPDLRVAIGGPGIVLLLGVPLTLWLLLRRGDGSRLPLALRRMPESGVLILTVSAIIAAIIYFFTPATAQGPKSAPFPGLVGGNSRTLMPALVLMGPALAWTATRLRLWPGRVLQVAAAAAVVDGLEQTFSLQLSGLIKFTIEVVVVLVIATVLVRRSRSWSHQLRQAAALGCAVVLALGGVALGEHAQRHFNHYRYNGLDAAVDWVLDNAPAGHRIGIAGDWTGGVLESPILPAFGPRFRNEVTYIGRMNVGTLIEYSKEQNFLAAVRRGHYDILLVGRALPPLGMPLVAPQWARAAGFREVAASDRFITFVSPSFRKVA